MVLQLWFLRLRRHFLEEIYLVFFLNFSLSVVLILTFTQLIFPVERQVSLVLYKGA